MSVLDIIVIAVLAVFTLIGLWKGFLRTILSLFSNLVSLTLAIVFAKTVAKFLDGIIGITSKLASPISNTIHNLLPSFETETAISSETIQFTGTNKLLEALIRPFVENKTYLNTTELANDIGQRLAALATIVITAIVLFILIKIVIRILSRIFDAITKAGAISGLDRTLGAIVGLIKGAVLVLSVLSILYTLNCLPFISSWFDGLIENSTITVKIYNLIQQLFDWITTKVNLSGIISNWIGNVA